MVNRYISDARLSERKFKELLALFCADVPALTASVLSAVNRKTSQRIYGLLRRRVVEMALEEARPFTGEVKIDGSYFGPRRVRGRRGRGAGGKTPVIGLLKRGGKVFTSVVANCSRAELEPIIKGQVLSKATVYTDGWLGYDGLLLKWLQTSSHPSPRKRVCPWKKPRQRHRELLELCQVSLRQTAWCAERIFPAPPQRIGMALESSTRLPLFNLTQKPAPQTAVIWARPNHIV